MGERAKAVKEANAPGRRTASEPRLFARALLAFIVLPGMVGYVLPLTLAPRRIESAPWQWAGLALVIGGSSMLIWCVREFYVSGKGTLAPWAPPRQLVVSGPYRVSRNPMYVAVASVLLGWSIWFASSALLVYALIVAVAFHLRVILYEEPTLARVFGKEWERYRRGARRWL